MSGGVRAGRTNESSTAASLAHYAADGGVGQEIVRAPFRLVENHLIISNIYYGCGPLIALPAFNGRGGFPPPPQRSFAKGQISKSRDQPEPYSPVDSIPLSIIHRRRSGPASSRPPSRARAARSATHVRRRARGRRARRRIRRSGCRSSRSRCGPRRHSREAGRGRDRTRDLIRYGGANFVAAELAAVVGLAAEGATAATAAFPRFSLRVFRDARLARHFARRRWSTRSPSLSSRAL